MKKLIILTISILTLISCSKPKNEYAELLENKRWYIYKLITNTDTINMSRQYWLEVSGGVFKDYDKYDGTYTIKKDTLHIYFFNYGYENYIIESVDNNNLILKQTNPKGFISHRKLFFEK